MPFIEQTVPPLSTALTTAAAVELELGVAADPRTERLIAQASRAIVSHCGRPFAAATWSETFTSDGSPLLLSRYPVRSLVSVTQGDTPLDSTQYRLKLAAGLLYRRYAWPSGFDGMFYSGTVVVYTAGFLLPGDAGSDLPEDVERAAIEAVKGLWFAGGAGARDPSIRSETIEGIGSTSYQTAAPGSYGLPLTAIDLLVPYRRTA